MSRPANKILAALPDEEYQRLEPKLHQVSYPLGKIVYVSEQPIEEVLFINRGIISWLATLADGSSVEAGVIGPEGVGGFPAVLGATSTPNEGLAQSPVEALRITPTDLIAEFRRGGMLQDLFLRFTNNMVIQIAQTAACNRLHALEQRLARWLLMTQDRTDGNEFTLTQEFLSRMLGVRRDGVSVAANTLREMGLIDYRRGDIRLLDRRKLKDVACECYEVVKAEYDPGGLVFLSVHSTSQNRVLFPFATLSAATVQTTHKLAVRVAPFGRGSRVAGRGSRVAGRRPTPGTR